MWVIIILRDFNECHSQLVPLSWFLLEEAAGSQSWAGVERVQLMVAVVVVVSRLPSLHCHPVLPRAAAALTVLNCTVLQCNAGLGSGGRMSDCAETRHQWTLSG